MHWLAIRRSQPRSEVDIFRDDGEARQTHDACSIRKETLQMDHFGPSIAQRHDEARDDESDFVQPTSFFPTQTHKSPQTSDTASTGLAEALIDTHMPMFSTGLTTFAYQRALRNRILNAKIIKGGEYDIHSFTPTFIYDCLMLPGSLVALFGKSSTESMIHRMTPALLSGFRAHVHSESQGPCLMQSVDSDYVQGMVVFGQGRKSRRRIHEHYRPHARRVKVQVEIDVLVPKPLLELETPNDRWALQRRTLWAHTWLWSNVASVDTQFRVQSAGWNLEDYLAGDLGPRQSLLVERQERGDSTGEETNNVDFDCQESSPAKTGEVYGGIDLLDSERVAYSWAGW